MTEISENLLRRARALHETAQRGGSENEMTLAAEHLATMVGKYNITQEMLQSSHVAVCIVKNVNGKYRESWRTLCYSSAATLFFCDYFFKSVGEKNVAVIHSVVGEEHNVEVALEMGAFFEATINRLANEGSRTNKQVTEDHTHRHRFIRSFRLAAAQRLQIRINDYVGRAKQGQLTEPDTGLLLPSLLSLYERQELLFAAFLKSNGITLTAATPRDQQLSALGKALGARAGDGISFTTQIKSGSASAGRALPGH